MDFNFIGRLQNDWGSFIPGGNDAKRWSKGGGKAKKSLGSLFIRDNSVKKSFKKQYRRLKRYTRYGYILVQGVPF